MRSCWGRTTNSQSSQTGADTACNATVALGVASIKSVVTPLIPGAVKLIRDFGGPSPSLLKPQYFGNVPLVFLCCSKFARSLCYCTRMSDSYQMRQTISSLRVLPINPLSQCMKFSCTTLLCLIARGSTKQGGGNFSDFHKVEMKMQLFGSNI